LLLSRIWKDKEWLKVSLRQIRSKARREKLVRELDLTKPERYILNRYLNAKKRLSIQKVAAEVAYYYGVPKNMALEIVRRIRGRAYTAKSRKGRKEVHCGQAGDLKAVKGRQTGGRPSGAAAIPAAKREQHPPPEMTGRHLDLMDFKK